MKKLKLFFIIAILGSLLFPLVSLAGTYQAGSETIYYDGLVPCGKEVYQNAEFDENGSFVTGNPIEVRCQFCHFFVMLEAIIDFVLFQLVPPIAILMIVIGGIMFFAAAGSPEKLGTAKKLLTSVVIGLVIIFASWIIVDLFLASIGLSEFSIQAGLSPGEWNKIQCTIELPK